MRDVAFYSGSNVFITEFFVMLIFSCFTIAKGKAEEDSVSSFHISLTRHLRE